MWYILRWIIILNTVLGIFKARREVNKPDARVFQVCHDLFKHFHVFWTQLLNLHKRKSARTISCWKGIACCNFRFQSFIWNCFGATIRRWQLMLFTLEVIFSVAGEDAVFFSRQLRTASSVSKDPPYHIMKDHFCWLLPKCIRGKESTSWIPFSKKTCFLQTYTPEN